MERPMVSCARSVFPPLDLELRQVAVFVICHNFHWCCKGRRVFVSVQQNNNITLHTNSKCKIVQTVKKIQPYEQ